MSEDEITLAMQYAERCPNIVSIRRKMTDKIHPPLKPMQDRPHLWTGANWNWFFDEQRKEMK
jgi:hypothetical protein